MSMFDSLNAARDRWRTIWAIAVARGEAVRIGYHIAEVRLDPGNGYDCEDLKRVDQHLTIWGDPTALAGAVSRIYPAETPTG